MPKRIDANQRMIVRALRDTGVSVQSLADLGRGVPDLLCGYKGRNVLMEVKDSSQPPSRRRLTEDEQNWHDKWRGQVVVVETVEDALRVIGII